MSGAHPRRPDGLCSTRSTRRCARPSREFAHEVVAPVIAEHYEQHTFPYEIVRQMGKMGLFGLPFPERVRRHGRRLPRARASPSRSWPGSTPVSRSRWRPRCRWARCRSTGSAPTSRRRSWLPRLVSGEALAAFGLTEPGFGSDAGARRPGRCSTRPTSGSSTAAKAFITNSGTDITALVAVAAVTGAARTAQGVLHDPRALGHARLHRRSRLLQGRLVRLRHPRADLRRCAGCRRRTCSASGAVASPSSCRPWTRAGSRSRRWRPAWPRAAWTSRCATPASGSAFGQPIGELPGDPVHDRRHGGCGPTPPGWPGDDAAARMLARRGLQAAGRHRQAARQRDRGGPTPGRRPRSTAATAS